MGVKVEAKPIDSKLKQYTGLMSSVDWDDKRYQEDAKIFIKSNQVLSVLAKDSKQIRTRILSNFSTLSSMTNVLVKEREIT